ncbi:MAG: hypothetical protein AAF513_12925 [Pseudomonadota bacterium]
MSWEALGALAELVGALAVIVSIVYLAAQVRHTRRQLMAQVEDNITARAFDAYNPVYEGDNARIFRKGLQSPEQLDEDEAFVFRLLIDRQRGAFAVIVRRRDSGAIPAVMAESFLKGYRQLFLHSAGGQVWLEEARHGMSRLELETLGTAQD